MGEDTTLGKVIRLVETAEAYKPDRIRLIDRHARWFTPLILACAALAWGLTGEASRAVAVLIVGCPCALPLAAPTAIVATIGRAARSGILVKGGKYLEAAAAAQVVLFDFPVSGGGCTRLGPVNRFPASFGKLLHPPGWQVHVDQNFHDAKGTSLSSARQAAYDNASSISSRSR